MYRTQSWATAIWPSGSGRCRWRAYPTSRRHAIPTVANFLSCLPLRTPRQMLAIRPNLQRAEIRRHPPSVMLVSIRSPRPPVHPQDPRFLQHDKHDCIKTNMHEIRIEQSSLNPRRVYVCAIQTGGMSVNWGGVKVPFSSLLRSNKQGTRTQGPACGGSNTRASVLWIGPEASS